MPECLKLAILLFMNAGWWLTLQPLITFVCVVCDNLLFADA